jgi:hypothetical protein
MVTCAGQTQPHQPALSLVGDHVHGAPRAHGEISSCGSYGTLWGSREKFTSLRST